MMPISLELIEMITWTLGIIVVILVLIYHLISIPKRIRERRKST